MGIKRNGVGLNSISFIKSNLRLFLLFRTKVKQLRREKNLESRQIREQEQNNARIALKDLKSKFTIAKQRELEIQKDTLNRR